MDAMIETTAEDKALLVFAFRSMTITPIALSRVNSAKTERPITDA
jgi:hypothetical protein